MKKKRITALTVIALLTASCFIPQGAFAYSKKDFEYAIEHYQQTPQQYEHDSEAAVQEPSQTSPRFTLDDGIYKNKDAKVTNQATLMITGDLMCQYRQQEAVFQSDGKSYLSYEDVAALMKKIDEEYAQQQAALEEAEKEQTAADSNETTEKDKATEKAPPLLDEADTAKP